MPAPISVVFKMFKSYVVTRIKLDKILSVKILYPSETKIGKADFSIRALYVIVVYQDKDGTVSVELTSGFSQFRTISNQHACENISIAVGISLRKFLPVTLP